ncbi:proteasome assembly chaperone family protein [Natronomonas salina]|uniref:proteasome assembly chaperone family protein n=1 Tax=Natronomonas salina TaxID=1710540 RepID=UPI0015B60D27|nr:PAC2 family protein [Natronomonas salina]QLD89577.1 proteasome assembly chaperone family protein [Natronomonas salina]
MGTNDASTRFEGDTALPTDSATLVEGVPGLGMVAAITVDQLRTQLGLEQHGTIVSEDLPPVVAFQDGRVRDAVRVYAGRDPAVMTLESDVPIPPAAVDSLSQCVIDDLAESLERAVFLAGAPAQSEEQIGEVVGVATTMDLEHALADADIALAEGSGAVGGVTGSLLKDCYHANLPAAVLIVGSNPYLPDPTAARAVIEDALEPLVDFDVDTGALVERAEEIQQ